MRALFLCRIVFVCLLGFITYLTVTPNPDDTDAGFAFTRWIADVVFGSALLGDKVAHFVAYSGLGLSAFSAKILTNRNVFVVPLGLALYGAALEGVQALGGVRSPELGDAIANSAGAIAGYGAGYLAATFASRNRQ